MNVFSFRSTQNVDTIFFFSSCREHRNINDIFPISRCVQQQQKIRIRSRIFFLKMRLSEIQFEKQMLCTCVGLVPLDRPHQNQIITLIWLIYSI
jgi:hypothetical protein